MKENLIDLEAFYTPFDDGNILIKRDAKDPTIVYIEASNETPDKQEDIVFTKALEEQTENFLSSGLVSWDHLHKLEKSPEYIIGEPLDVGFKKEGTFIKAKLYKTVKYANDVIDLLAGGCTRLGASIGGFIKKRKKLSKALSAILSIIWDEVAITYKPVNIGTLGNVSLIPIGAFAKALMVGGGVDAGNFTGGRAMIQESLQGNQKGREDKIQKIVNELIWRIKEGDLEFFNKTLE